ncbi:MAG: sulfotransferase [Cyanobacteria bacterium J06632_3]
MNSPIVLVGLPRSGSTLLSRIINESSECFMVSDFYYLQYVESLDGYHKKDCHTKGLLVDFVVSQLKNRTKPEHLEDEIWFGLPFSAAQIEQLEAFAQTYKDDSAEKDWAEVLNDAMQFAAQLCGRPVWGYNTPQDYLNADRLLSRFPDTKFLFLLRSPARTLLSYKYYWTTEPKFRKDRGRYHPAVQSLAWKTCAKSYLALQEKLGSDKCTLIKFEDVVSHTDKIVSKISKFASVSFPSVDISKFGNNSSLNKDGKKKALTQLEKGICQFLTRKESLLLGYKSTKEASSHSVLRSSASGGSLLNVGKDVADLLATTGRNASFYLSQFVFSKNTRKRVIRFVRKVAST